jgi:hypothetical protein
MGRETGRKEKRVKRERERGSVMMSGWGFLSVVIPTLFLPSRVPGRGCGACRSGEGERERKKEEREA